MTRRLNSGREKQKLLGRYFSTLAGLEEQMEGEDYVKVMDTEIELDDIREQPDEWGPERGDDA